nr:VOC family protein [Psychromicrobium silvestre]
MHHIELWVKDFDRSRASLGWMFERLGYVLKDSWRNGASWQGEGYYLVLESGPDVRGAHERRDAGLNHLAFSVASEREIDAITVESKDHGWQVMFADLHPHAGGPDHYGAYLENPEGFEVEIVVG